MLLEDSDTEISPDMANFVTNKCFYDVNTPTRYSTEEIRRYFDEEKIVVSGTNAPTPFMNFTDYNWPKSVLNLFRRNDYSRPTPIQASCWPISLSGRDLIGIAVTGSGMCKKGKQSFFHHKLIFFVLFLS